MVNKITLNIPAPDFELTDTSQQTIRLSDYQGKKLIVLVLNRGFVWPYCRKHLEQLRQDYAEFQARNAEILAIGPDGPNAFKRHWEANQIPFIGMADIKSKVADRYCQEVNILKFGRMPAMFIIDLHGIIRYSHYGNSMSDIPSNLEILGLLDELNKENG